jgi:hypothetical protein
MTSLVETCRLVWPEKSRLSADKSYGDDCEVIIITFIQFALFLQNVHHFSKTNFRTSIQGHTIGS